MVAALVCAGSALGAGSSGTATAAKTPAIENTPLPPATGSTETVATGMGGTLLRMGIGLVLVVALVLGVWHLMKRAQRRGMPGMGPANRGLVDVVCTTALGPTRFLHLVRVGGELILVGATDHTVTAVARISGEQAAEIIGDDLEAAELQDAFDRAARTDDPLAGPPIDHAAAAPLVDRLRAMTARR